jgi:hypothetical protein
VASGTGTPTSAWKLSSRYHGTPKYYRATANTARARALYFSGPAAVGREAVKICPQAEHQNFSSS